jgi:hypothetical protein
MARAEGLVDFGRGAADDAPDAVEAVRRRLSVDELLARRRPRPEGVEPVSVESMNEAIAGQAARRAGA